MVFMATLLIWILKGIVASFVLLGVIFLLRTFRLAFIGLERLTTKRRDNHELQSRIDD